MPTCAEARAAASVSADQQTESMGSFRGVGGREIEIGDDFEAEPRDELRSLGEGGGGGFQGICG
jgi:hypothetical protein